tara:strand:+ start:9083 stop:10645 length:1563 start_codon:yes stop_codon:yes gene_type:complete
MSEMTEPNNWVSTAGGWAVGIGFVTMGLESAFIGESVIGTSFCCLGIFGLIAGAMVSNSGAALSSDGAMVLKQNSTGQWEWMPNSNIPEPVVNDPAANYNDQNTQIMSRLVSEIRGGRTLQDLDDNELSIVANTYGVNSGSKQQKIEALHNSVLAKSGLKLGAIGVAAGVGAVGASRIIKSGRERAIARAEELREQGREKLQENIDAGKYNINSRLPTSESGEEATEVAHNIVLDQLRKQIEQRGLTPEMLFQIADMNKDGKLDANEITGAMTAATGFAVPVFIVSDAMNDFDLDKDGKLDLSEVNKLWEKLGFEPETDNEFSDEEIDAVLEEVDSVENDTASQEQLIAEQEARLLAEQEAARQAEEEARVQSELEAARLEEEAAEHTAEQESAPEVHDGSGELTEGIDTEFERLVLEMEGARFSSERKTLMEKQTAEFLVNLRIEKMERTLIGDPLYRGGQSVHALIDGGPYVGVIKIPVSFDEKILEHKAGDEIQVWAKLVDFSPSLKRPVLEASEMI